MNKNTIGYVFIIILLIVASAISLNLFFKERAMHDRLDIKTFPLEVGEWKGREIKIEEYVYSVLQTRNLITREYTDPAGDKLTMTIVYSETNRSVFHPPEVCMMGSGISITNKSAERMTRGEGSFMTNKLFMEKGDYKGLALYSYKAGDLYTENFYLQQIYLIFHQILGRQVPAATIRVEMPLKSSEERTLPVLKKFLEDTVTILDRLS